MRIQDREQFCQKEMFIFFLARERAAPVSHFVWAFLSLLDPRFGMSWIGPLRVHNFAIAQVRSLVQAKRTKGDFSINP